MRSRTGITTAAVLVGALTLGTGGAALISHTETVSAAAAPSAASAVTHGHRGRHVHHAARRHARAGLRVTRVSGTTIDAMRGTRAVTVIVGSATTYKEGGQTVRFSAVQPGERITVKGTRGGTHTIQATVVRILLSREAGRITTVSRASYTITTARGVTHTVLTTAYTRGGTGTSASVTVPLTTGARIMAQGTLSPDGKTLTAVRVVVRSGAASAAARSSMGAPRTNV